MIYNYILSFIFGSLIKTYDDIFDNELFKKFFSEISIESIKNFTISIYSIISVNNVNVPIIILISHILLYMIDNESLNNPFFISGMIVTLFLCMVNFNKDIFNMKAVIFSILGMILGLWVDHILFPEEYSTGKIISRCILLGLTIFAYYYFTDYVISDFVYFCSGYLITSIVNMSILKLNESDIKPKLESLNMKDNDKNLNEDILPNKHAAQNL